MKCPDCSGEMDFVDNPTERFRFRVPFTDIEIHAVDFGAKRWLCIQCYTDKHDEPYRRAYDAGAQDGYEEGIRSQGVMK